MTLPKGTKGAARPLALTVRISKKAVAELKELAKKNGLSQADVIEYLIHEEFNQQKSTGKKRVN